MNQLFLIDIPKGSLPLETQWSRTKELTSIHILVKLPYNLGVERTSRDNSFSFCRHQFYIACTYFSATWSTFATAENMSSTIGRFVIDSMLDFMYLLPIITFFQMLGHLYMNLLHL